MPNVNYIKGRQFEYQIRDRLRKGGYEVVRAYASKGLYDLLAVRRGETLMVQCKRSRAVPSMKDWNGLYDLALNKGAIPILASRIGVRGVRYWRLMGPRSFRQSAKALVVHYDPFGQGTLF